MYLMDCIAQAPKRVDLHDALTGRILHLPGAGTCRDDIVNTPVRYVMDDAITALCADMVRNRQDFLSGALDILRAPFPEFWVEWNETVRARLLADQPSTSLTPACSRAGILVKMDASERSGSLRVFWSKDGQSSDINPAILEFDLDAAQSPQAGWALKAPNDSLQGLFDTVSVRLDPEWDAYYRTRSSSPVHLRNLLAEAIGPAAFDFPFMLAFVLLIMAQVREIPRTDLSALNRRRIQSGRPELLEHVALTHTMFAPATECSPGASIFDRAGPRLHLVRGHLVRRGDKVFWRTSHFRGRVSGPPLQKTIRLVLPNAA
ncbi:MAG: hypothetical protein FP825_16655 [Hyphomonas sp.]|uniref:hypothetical protein n=1 Tax=Hyphomonas sp. TaxID=87 RepID=UPI0018050BCB|nr:hypothetical protein [Hyphomonas sp.]MBA3070101.1 hypothetical protein [Hyphomonas sp.]MBU3921278.1 hypothetical protein [Alphaproteobacteria bacterium]MBU4060323.1 hypothetical protein [Alphaproteobacteria bacterium]MBU4162991.1 hypothetical protein [Alphaproteobacteria bacterium]